MDHRVLVVLLSLWSSGFWTGVTDGAAVISGVTFEQGENRCSGTLEIKHQGNWTEEDELRSIDEKCRQLNCGPPAIWQTNRSRTSSIIKIACSGFLWTDGSTAISDGFAFEEEASRCDGTMILDLSNVLPSDGKLMFTDVLCRRLGCGSVVSSETTEKYASRSLIEFTCSGFWTGDTDGAAVILSDGVMFEEGQSRCSGKAKIKHQVNWTTEDVLTSVAVMCRRLDCGSVVLWKTIGNLASSSLIEFTCSESVRLNGTNRCSGKLEVKSDESWSSVCEGEFDQQVAEVVCRELDCGVPSVLQGALYGEVEAPVRSRKFQCDGKESHLLECHRSTCISGRALGLTCSDHDEFRLVGGASHCSGELELKKRGVWGAVGSKGWNLKDTNTICHHLNCGSTVSTRLSYNPSEVLAVWGILWSCAPSIDQLTECLTTSSTWDYGRLYMTCTESVRLKGTNRCSGRLEVKSDESWSSVCEGELDQQVAEVVCRELACGAPSVLQGALYGEVEAPVRSRKFQCDGKESQLLECEWSESVTSTCSPDKAVELTCSGPLKLVGEVSRCAGELQINHQGEYRPVIAVMQRWNHTLGDKVCKHLHCGSVVSTSVRDYFPGRLVWFIDDDCAHSESSLWECVNYWSDEKINKSLQVICSESVRLNRTNRCSGRLEVKSNESWSSVCEGELDQQVAEVVCRELACGAPSVLQGALYGEVEAPVRSRKFQCKGKESHLLECEWSESVTSTCSPDKAVELTCSGPLKLVGEESRCAGELQINHQGEYRPVFVFMHRRNTTLGDKVCKHLDCGSFVSTSVRDYFPGRPMGFIDDDCAHSESSLWECVHYWSDEKFNISLQVICSDLLVQPNVSASPIVGVSGAKQQGLHVLLGYSFTVTCSTGPQYQGGSFQLLFTSSDTTQNYTLPAVNHSAHFLFPAARRAHRGDYTCVYHAYVFSYNFSSESRPLHLIVSASVTDLIIRCVVALLILTVSTPILYFHYKATGRRSREQNLQLLIAQRQRPETRQRRRRSTAAAGRRASRVNVE